MGSRLPTPTTNACLRRAGWLIKMASTLNVDPQVQQVLQVEGEKAKFQALVHSLTDMCWEKCMEKPSNRLDSRTEKCLVNCVERFLDSTNLVVSRLANTGGNMWGFMDKDRFYLTRHFCLGVSAHASCRSCIWPLWTRFYWPSPRGIFWVFRFWCGCDKKQTTLLPIWDRSRFASVKLWLTLMQ